MTRFPFLDSLEDLIVEQFELLNPDYAREVAQDVSSALSVALEQENDVLYALVDNETTRLASPHLFESRQDARAHCDREGLTGCLVATLIPDEEP